MAVRYEQTTINSAEWGLNTLPATQGLQVLTWLLELIGGPIGRAIGDIVVGAKTGELTIDRVLGLLGPDTLSEVIDALTGHLVDERTIKNVKILLKDADRNKETIKFDEYFAGNYGELAQVVAWAVRINFESFFSGNPLLKAAGARAGVKLSTPQKT